MKTASKKNTKEYAGFVAILGRPNVGKSTLLNIILGEKISITSKKPQTTREQILGIKTKPPYQIVYVDTPGLLIHEKRVLNKRLNKKARSALRDVNAVLFVIEANRWTDEDEHILSLLAKLTCPIILAINKVDLYPQKETLLPFLKMLAAKFEFQSIIPLSAKKETNIQELEKILFSLMPEHPFYFAADQITDRSLNFRISEIIREKLMRLLGQELPYVIDLQVESVELKNDIHHVHAIIWVTKPSQKAIVIGKNGTHLKEIGIQARRDLEKLLKTKVQLRLWVKVKS